MPDETIRGDHSPTSTAIKLVNDNKYIEESVLRMVDMLMRRADVDLRWLAVARTHLEQGFMALNRALLRPERIVLPEDNR